MLLPMLLAGVLAYTMGKNAGKKAAKKKTGGDYPTPPLPLPGVDDPMPEAEPAPESSWDTVGFEVEIYPAGGKPYVNPPAHPDGFVVGGNCRAIAIGKGWWDRVGYYVEELLDAGVKGHNELRHAVIERYAPVCLGSKSAAAKALRDEIQERLEESVPIVHQGKIHKNGSSFKTHSLVAAGRAYQPSGYQTYTGPRRNGLLTR